MEKAVRLGGLTLTGGGGQPESCKFEDIEVIPADLLEGEKVDTRHLDDSCCEERRGKVDGGDRGKGEKGKIGEYEGEVCKSVADDVNAWAESLHKNVRPWTDLNQHRIFTKICVFMSPCYS